MKTHDQNYLYNPIIGNFLSWFIGVAIMALYVNGMVASPWPMVVGCFIGSIWSLWLHGYREAERIHIKKISINHKHRLIQRATVCLIAGLAIHGLSAYGSSIAAVMIRAFACSLFLGTCIWLFFDFFLNYHRELPLTYITSDPGGARSDVVFYKKTWLWIASKVIGIVAGAALYYWVLTLPLE